jgi:hypothetical protein
MENHTQQALKAASSLRATLAVLISQLDDLCDILEAEPAIARGIPAIDGSAGLDLNRASYTLKWGVRTCVLGHTMAFRLMARLARRPNEYVHVEDLLDELWQGTRSYSTVRSTVCRLKVKLCAAAMADLAAMIDGSMRNHYGLVLRPL